MDTTTTLTPAEVIDRVQQARNDEQDAAIRQIQMAVAWALLHPCPAGEWPAHWGDPCLDEQVTPLAGPGAPLVAEWAPAQLAAALTISIDAGRRLIGEGLELVYRLPGLWVCVVAGVVPVWRARLIAAETYDLSPEAVAFADRLIAATPEKIRWSRPVASWTRPGSTSTPTARPPTRNTSSPSAVSGSGTPATPPPPT